MVSLTKAEKIKLKEILTKSEDKEAKSILNKLNKEKKLKYAYNKKEIVALLKKAYKEKKRVKINYYSLSSDEVKWRKVDIYQIGDDFIIAYCHLRDEERTFIIKRINQVAILDESYKSPNGWSPKSKVW
jgi:predicted DNA-binding transcriptional regulator YafY